MKRDLALVVACALVAWAVGDLVERQRDRFLAAKAELDAAAADVARVVRVLRARVADLEEAAARG